MRRSLLGTVIAVLAVSPLMWTLAPVMGGGHRGDGHRGGGYAPAHVGSVHYGARPAPARVAPVWPGAVRAEHYAGSAFRGAYRNPYRDEYFRRFRPGYYPFIFGDAQYYGYYSLPPDCQPVVLNGITYYLCDGVYYQAYIYGGQTVYVAVPY
jgi:hypothetical protein